MYNNKCSQSVFTKCVHKKGTNQKQPPPTPNSHEDSEEHGAAIIKQMGHLEIQAHEGLL